MEALTEILAGTPAGGGQDRAARALAVAIAGIGEPVPAVVNVPGRGGGNVWDALAAQVGDPRVVAISSPTLVTNRMLGEATIDHRDLTAIANLYTEFIVFAVPAGSPLGDGRTLAGVLASSAPPAVAFATALGNINHMALATVVLAGGGDPAALDLRVFDSARDAVADVLGGGAEIVAVSAPSVVPEVADGRLVPLAVSAESRLASPLSAAPTWRELGIDCVIGTWRGVVAPPGLDPAATRDLDGLVGRAMDTPAWADALDRHGWSDTRLRATRAAAFLEEQRGMLGEALADLGLVGPR